MADQKGQPKKGGRNMTTSATRKARYVEYRNHHTREKHKLARILKSSYAAAEKYARARTISGILAKIVSG
jgi:hypothetical protein